MSAPWWPPGAPVPARRLGELTSCELAALIRFAEGAEVQGADVGRFAGFLALLRAEAAERAEYARQFTAHARAGLPGIPPRPL